MTSIEERCVGPAQSGERLHLLLRVVVGADQEAVLRLRARTGGEQPAHREDPDREHDERDAQLDQGHAVLVRALGGQWSHGASYRMSVRPESWTLTVSRLPVLFWNTTSPELFTEPSRLSVS